MANRKSRYKEFYPNGQLEALLERSSPNLGNWLAGGVSCSSSYEQPHKDILCENFQMQEQIN